MTTSEAKDSTTTVGAWPGSAASALLALLPLLAVALVTVAASYRHQTVRCDVAFYFALLGAPAIGLAGCLLLRRRPGWICVMIVVTAVGLIPVGLSAAGLGRALFDRLQVAPRRDALLAFAHDPVARANMLASGGVWEWTATSPGQPVVAGLTFEAAAFTDAGAWLLLRFKSSYHATGIFVPYADVRLEDVESGALPRPQWAWEGFTSTGADGIYRFVAAWDMGGNGHWSPDRERDRVEHEYPDLRPRPVAGAGSVQGAAPVTSR